MTNTGTLLIDDGHFIQRWGWVPGLYETQDWVRSDVLCFGMHHKLAELWPGQIRCARVEAIRKDLDAAFVSLGCESTCPPAMMPLKGRGMTLGQLVWVEIIEMPREAKGPTSRFLRPAKSSARVGDVDEQAEPPFAPPYRDAARIIVAQSAFRRPNGIDAEICTDPSVAQLLAQLAEPVEQIGFAVQGLGTGENAQGSLLIEPVSTLTAIDVNGPQRVETNMAAASLIAAEVLRQNIGGLIIVDFLKPRDKAQRQLVVEALSKGFDQAYSQSPPSITTPKTSIGSMDHRGLVVIERERRGQRASSLDGSDDVPDMGMMLDRAMSACPMRLHQRLLVSRRHMQWLGATDFRRRVWSNVLKIEPDDGLQTGDWRWEDDRQ